MRVFLPSFTSTSLSQGSRLKRVFLPSRSGVFSPCDYLFLHLQAVLLVEGGKGNSSTRYGDCGKEKLKEKAMVKVEGDEEEEKQLNMGLRLIEQLCTVRKFNVIAFITSKKRVV